jgi:putative ABC transport system permease protein
VIYGIDDSYRRLTGGFELLQGRDMQNGQEILADDVYVKNNKLKLGQRITFWNHDFTLVGIVQSGRGARLYIPLPTAQDLLGSAGKVTMFFVRLDDPKQTESALAAVKILLPGYNVRSMEEYTSLMTVANFPGLEPFVNVMISISVIIGFLVIFLAMYTTVLERTREIGILKSLGASKLYIANLILRETAMVSLLGIVAGAGASFGLRKLVLKAFPTLTVQITTEWIVWAALIAVAGSLVGALYPAWRAARQDPIAALAYE